MGEGFPRCVREAWDSVEESQAPATPPTLSSEDSGPWPLLLYPKLGHFTWDDQDFNRELDSDPCGLLRRHCRVHGPRTQTTSGRGAEPPDGDPTLKTKTHESQTPSGEATAAQEFRRRSPRRGSPRSLPPPVPRHWRPRAGARHPPQTPAKHCSPFRPPAAGRLAAADLTHGPGKAPRLPPLPLAATSRCLPPRPFTG